MTMQGEKMWIVGHLWLFSFDYERFRLDNKKRVVPMGGMKTGTVESTTDG